MAWFRRHVRIAKDAVGLPLVIRIEAAGSTELFLDGERILSATGDSAEAWAKTSFASRSGVLAVRRQCRGCLPGFVVTMAW